MYLVCVMIDISNYLISEFPLRLKKVEDIIEFDGPILSHFKDESGADYLYYWVDWDSTANRWLVWQTTSKAIEELKSEDDNFSRTHLPTSNQECFIVDIDANINYHNAYKLLGRDINEKYKPSK
jgi:hypothetical protein